MIEVSYAIFVFDLFYYLGNQLQLSLYVEGFVKYTTQYMNNPFKITFIFLKCQEARTAGLLVECSCCNHMFCKVNYFS